MSAKEYTNFQQAILSVDLAQRDLLNAMDYLESGDTRNFIMRVEWAHNQLESAVARLAKEKEAQ